MKKMNKKGFTLVEIMIVVAIIGLLAAIGIPSFTKARSNSRTKACMNNLRMIESGAEQYMMIENVNTVTKDQALTYVKGGSVSCGASGTYAELTFDTSGGAIASCSVHGDIATEGADLQ